MLLFQVFSFRLYYSLVLQPHMKQQKGSTRQRRAFSKLPGRWLH
jgi:hypothetical protein